MAYLQIEQLSPEWFEHKLGKISGTRYGQAISTRENTLIEELASEIMDGFVEPFEFENEDMLFGTENEPIAADKYEAISGIKFLRGGVMQSDTNANHMASPDGITEDGTKVLEVKCTRHGKTHLKRFRKGIDSNYLPQVINYFAVDPKVQEVHWVSYCPFRPEREIVSIIFTRDTVLEVKEFKTKPTEITTIQSEVERGLKQIPIIDAEVKALIESFNTTKF